MRNKYHLPISLFSSQSLVVFDNVKVIDNTIDAGLICETKLFNFTSVKGTYLVTLRTPTSSQQVVITIT